jgi:hypothetical protein
MKKDTARCGSRRAPTRAAGEERERTFFGAAWTSALASSRTASTSIAEIKFEYLFIPIEKKKKQIHIVVCRFC